MGAIAATGWEDEWVNRVDDVLAGLDPEQRAVAEAVRGPVCVLAGAGTGKTRAITHRIAHAVRSGYVDASSVLAVTFTTRAAGELRQRLRALGAPGVQARTFHAAALRQLTYFWPKVIGGAAPSVIESKLPVLREACRITRTSPDVLRDLASEVEWAKVVQVGPEDYLAAAAKFHRTPPVPAEEMARVYDAYEQIRRERHLVDFETILELTAAVMTEHQEVAGQIRQQYRYFVVDEYQDVNPLQKLLLDTWLGGRNDLCVVGDPNQTIYSFTGASPRYLTGFAVEHPDAAVIKLVRDYRSTPQVVDLANLVIAKGRSPHRLELVAQRPEGPKPLFREHDDEPAEAADVARSIRKLMDKGVASREIAVLFRVNSQSEAYEAALAKAEIPYVLRGAERFFERPEVRQAVVLLRGAARSAAGEPLAAEVHTILTGLGLTPAAPGGGKAREKWESLKALADLAEDMAAGGRPARVRGRAGAPGQRAARAAGRGRHAGLPARRQGPGVGRRVPGRPHRRHAADHLRGNARAGRGGAKAALCGYHPGPRASVALVGAGARAGRSQGPPPLPFPRRPDRASRRAAARLRCHVPGVLRVVGLPSAPPGRHAGVLPRVRAHPGRRRRAEARPLRHLPGRIRRGPAGQPQVLARCHGQGGQDPAVRRLHRRHTAGDRRTRADHRAGAAVDRRHRQGQARQVRRGGPGDLPDHVTWWTGSPPLAVT